MLKSAGRVMPRLYFPDPDPKQNGECLDCTSKNRHHSEQNTPSATDLIYEMTFVIERSHSTIPAGKLIERTNGVFSPCRLQGGKSSCVPLNIVECSAIGIIIGACLHRDWIRKSPILWPEDPNATRFCMSRERDPAVFCHRLRKSGSAPLGIRIELNGGLRAPVSSLLKNN